MTRQIKIDYFVNRLNNYFFNCLKLVNKCTHKQTLLIELNNRFTKIKKGSVYEN